MKTTFSLLAFAAMILTASFAQAGCIPGPKRDVENVRAHSTDVYHLTFRGGELAVVGLSGDGDTDLDLYVYDQFGNLISCDTDMSDDCVASWVPAWSGTFTIHVRNRGSVYNVYDIATN